MFIHEKDANVMVKLRRTSTNVSVTPFDVERVTFIVGEHAFGVVFGIEYDYMEGGLACPSE